MKLSLVLQHLLVFTSALALTRAQTISAPTTTTETSTSETSTNTPAVTTMTTSTVPSVLAGTSAQPWTAPAIFYPFGSSVGDTEHAVNYDESSYSVGLSTPFTFFGHTYNSIYVIYNGLLTFTITPTSGPNYSPFRGTEDFIAALWNDFDDYFSGVLSYQQYTNGSVLNRATQDINQYFSPLNFNASWVFVVTWKYGSQSNPEILFQAVLISGGNQSYFLMNYGDCAVLYEAVEAGYNTINSARNFTIPDSTNGNYQNLKNTSNVNVPGRWAFNAWAAPAIFYPFGSAVGDTEHSEIGAESYSFVGLSTPFTYFGHTYNSIYVNYNGLLTFNMRSVSGPYYNPSRGTEDVIAALWNDFDDDYSGLFSYQQYTNGSVLDRATQDVSHYFSPGNFSASWVFVVTWRYSLQPNPAILFQVVLVSDGARSFFLMNYGNCAVLYGQVEAGYDTISSISNFVIPDSTNGNYQNLKNTSNVNVPGRWAFSANNGSAVTTMTTSAVPSVLASTSVQPWTAPAIFYPFGSSVGDTEHYESGAESYYSVGLSTPFTFFGHTYNSIYVIYNGLLTFTITSTSGPNYSPFRGTEDFIAALWNDFDDYYSGVLSYQQYTNGSVLDRATQDINQYFSLVNFRASWVFVATWKYGSQPNPVILFQAVLISGGGQSYFLMNYGDCAVLYEGVEAGYDTINSISHFVIPDSTNGNYQNLKNTSNVNTPGRWAFNAWAAPAIFYPFGSTLGDTEVSETGAESYSSVRLSTPFTYFGHTYNNVYVNYNGLLTFNMRSMSGPYYNPSRGTEDVIAALWNDFDDNYSGLFSYQQYTNGSVLDRATQDINQYFSPGNFSASWVFVVTWRYNLQPNPAILFQVVLISDGAHSFFLMNYGNCGVLYGQVEAGYDTINSSNFVIPDSTNGNYQNLKNTSNVNVPGRWAFISNRGLEYVVGAQLRVTSFSDLTQSGNLDAVLQQIKQVLVSYGLSDNFQIKKRNVKKTSP